VQSRLTALLCALALHSIAIAQSSATAPALAPNPQALLTLADEPAMQSIARPSRYALSYPEQYRCVLLNATLGRSLRLIVTGQSAVLIAKRFDSAQQKLLEVKRFSMPAQRLNLFRAYVKIADLGRLASVDVAGGRSQRDWWLETARNGNYRSFARRSPRDLYFREVCLFLSRAAGDADSEHLFTDPLTGFISG
jgi:hypothetical protein